MDVGFRLLKLIQLQKKIPITSGEFELMAVWYWVICIWTLSRTPSNSNTHVRSSTPHRDRRLWGTGPCWWSAPYNRWSPHTVRPPAHTVDRWDTRALPAALRFQRVISNMSTLPQTEELAHLLYTSGSSTLFVSVFAATISSIVVAAATSRQPSSRLFLSDIFSGCIYVAYTWYS